MRWLEVSKRINQRAFLTGHVITAQRGDMFVSLHKEGRNGWVVKQYRGKFFASHPVLFDNAKTLYTTILSGN